MRTHQLARLLLEMDDMPAMTFDEEGYHELSTIIPATLYRRDPFHTVEFSVPVTLDQKHKSFRVYLLT
jgi:hypothetical protein